jgi:hypothetical protein
MGDGEITPITIKRFEMIANQKPIALIVPILLSLVACGGGDADQNVVRNLFAVGEVIDAKEDGGPVDGDVSSNDMGRNLSYSIAPDSGMQNGELLFNSDGTFIYTPNADFFGRDSVDYLVSNSNETARATLTINVINDFETLDEYGWELVWSDEFNDAGDIDSTLWSGVNASVAGGNLVITAAEGATSSLVSVNSIESGRIEARLRSAKGSGVSATLKLQPVNDNYDGDNQLSLMVADNGAVIAGAHYGLGLVSGVSMNDEVVSTVADEFHTYAVEWGNSKIRWYVDDMHIYTVDTLNTWAYNLSGDQVVVDNLGPFNQEMQIVLELTAPSEALPAQLLVDHIKVWSCDPTVDLRVEKCASKEKSKISRAASDRIEAVELITTEIFTDGREDSVRSSITSYLDQLSWHYTEDVTELSITTVNDPVIKPKTLEDDSGIVLDITNTFGSASVGIGVEGAELIGRDISLNFDLYIDSANTTSENFVVKMQSGDTHGGMVNWDINDLQQDTWISRSISLTEFIDNPMIVEGEAKPLDPSNLSSLMIVEVDAKAHFQLDNINLSCVNSESCFQGPLALQTPAAPKADPILYQAEEYISESGTGLEPTSDEGGGQNVAFVAAGDYLVYTIEAPGSGPYTIDYRVASPEGSDGFNFLIDGELRGTQTIPKTGDWQNWTTITSSEFILDTGVYTLRIDFLDGDQNLNWLELQPPITEIFIEAEDYDAESGISLEPTSDVGGGENIGWIDAGDYVEYTVTIPSDGDYLIEYRLASEQTVQGFDTSIGGSVVDSQELQATGGWQNWITQSSVVPLVAGEQIMRLDFIEGPININWIKLTRQ